jgi:Vitamin K-dependent gamma-carboxylase
MTEAPLDSEPERDADDRDSDDNVTDEPRTRESFFRFLADSYATADPRSLGLFRIALGTLLFVDAARRWPDIEAHYANTGWLTNHFLLFRPMSNYLFSLYVACSTPLEVKVLLALQLAANLLLALGFRTRVMHVLSVVLLVSLNSRNIMLENGGWVVLTLLSVWSMFLPLGRRFSVDALLASLRARRERTLATLNAPLEPARDLRPIVSLGVTALILQWMIIYYFNVIHKSAPSWRDGTAVYYFFQQDRMVTALGAWLRDFLPLSAYKLMTFGALASEATIALLLALPVRTDVTRMLAWVLVCGLHLSIDAVVQLGPFSWAMAIMFFALIPTQLWERVGRWLRAKRPARELSIDPTHGFSLALARIVKRLDLLDRIRFVASDTRAEEAARTWVVVEPAGGQRFTGVAAVLRLADALPCGHWPLFWLRIPGLRGFFERRLERASQKRAELAHYWQVEDLAQGADDPPPEVPPWRRFAGRVWGFGGEALVLFIMICCTSQVLIENAAVPRWLKPERRPEWMTAVVIYPRLFQGWSMFAPGPPMDDGRLVVDGRTRDGRHFDPLTAKSPTFDVQPKAGFRMNQIWGDFHRRISEDRFRAYWGGLRDFLKNHHEITGRPQDELVAFDVWFVSEIIPPPGQPKDPPVRRKLFSYGVVKD